MNSRQLLRMATLALAGALALTGCASGPVVRTDQDPAANFGAYRSWGFYTPGDNERPRYSTWVADRIKADVATEMNARGYVFTQASPDLLVNTRQATAIRQRVSPMFDYGFGYGYWGGPRWGFGPRFAFGMYAPMYGGPWDVDTYAIRTFNVDVVDARLNRLVWTGQVTSSDFNRTPQEKAADIDAAVRAVFSKYPFRAGSNQPVPEAGD